MLIYRALSFVVLMAVAALFLVSAFAYHTQTAGLATRSMLDGYASVAERFLAGLAATGGRGSLAFDTTPCPSMAVSVESSGSFVCGGESSGFPLYVSDVVLRPRSGQLVMEASA